MRPRDSDARMPVAHAPRHHQLAVGVERRPSPEITRPVRGALGVSYVLFLCVAEGPDFIALNLGRLHVHDQVVVHPHARLARILQQLRDGVDRHVSQAADGPHAHAFAEHPQDAGAISSGQAQDVVVDPQARRWQGAKGRSGDLPDGGEIVFTGAREVQPEGGKGAVRFFPDGAATGGRVRLLANGAGWDVDVRWLTGEVVLHRVQPAERRV